jgi:hypothetical protein
VTPAQLHYTSAPPGPDGSGFRFTAVSAGVPQGLLREAEQLIGYEPPRDFPARPDTEELKSFPKAFAFSELSDGGRLLSRSVYTGADYTGRWGNFHAHAVHLPPGARLPGGALPITAWESPRWSDTTPPDGSNRSTGPGCCAGTAWSRSPPPGSPGWRRSSPICGPSPRIRAPASSCWWSRTARTWRSGSPWPARCSRASMRTG